MEFSASALTRPCCVQALNVSAAGRYIAAQALRRPQQGLAAAGRSAHGFGEYTMRIGVLIGVVLLALGAWIASGRATYETNKAAVDIGVLQASVREEHVVPRWIGYVTLAAGVAVILGSTRRRS